MRKTVAVGLVAGALVGAVATAPATADDQTGTVTITFTKKTWKAVNAQMMVKPTGKAQKLSAGSFAFPGYAYDQYTIATKGGLAFVRADASLKVKNLVADLADDTMSGKVVGMATDYDLFDLANVKQGKKTKAQLNLGMGQASTLNQVLKTDIFTDGMRVGKMVYVPQ